MTLNDWLTSTVGEPARPVTARLPSRGRRCRGKSPTWRTFTSGWIQSPGRSSRFRGRAARRDYASRGEAARSEPTVARQLNEAISRLDARLSQISNPAPTRQAHAGKAAPDRHGRAGRSQVYRPAPPLSPASMDFAIAEIAARQNELDSPPPRQSRRAMPRRQLRPAIRTTAQHDAGRAGRSGFFVARTAPAQDHQPDRGAAASRSYRGIDRRVPQRTRRNPPGHHRGGAAPGDRIARERNPLAVPPHRREQTARQRRPDAGRHRERARRNPRGAALADAGRATHRLRRGDPQSRRQARPDPALERRSIDRAASSKARSRRCAASSPTSPPTTRWPGSPKTCTRCRRKVDQLSRADGNSDAAWDSSSSA